jgi:hypothetical protein
MVGEWEKGFIGLYSLKNKSTDIFKIDKNDKNKIVYSTTVPGKIKSIFNHRDNLICDNLVIKNGELV